jgi:hypothetical protein
MRLTPVPGSERAIFRARGDERLSGRHKGDPSGASKHGSPVKQPTDKKNRKHRVADVGRALRSIYDDTLRESVPDDFADLLGKLS